MNNVVVGNCKKGEAPVGEAPEQTFRSTCHGIPAAAGKSGAIIGAFVVQSYIDNAANKTNRTKNAIMALAVVNLLGFICTFLVPETRGRSLEEISGEDKELHNVTIEDKANEPKNDANEKTNDAKEGAEKTSVDKSHEDLIV
ncbi:hypothetical protein RIF29_38852 [Crotalaria pallida]|uniref:Phosphate transporter n=1 Tax=Crotalaria pallida TaxID=3830 RepID=A0AAN9HP51_CROPI